LRNIEIVVGPKVMCGYIEHDLRGFERRSYQEPIMYHDARDMTERSG
jgi:hypothetical protein